MRHNQINNLKKVSMKSEKEGKKIECSIKQNSFIKNELKRLLTFGSDAEYLAFWKMVCSKNNEKDNNYAHK